MANYIFRVAFVERGQAALWRERQSRGGQVSTINSEAVGRCELIEAHHIEEAIETARRRFPDFTVMREGCEELCRA